MSEHELETLLKAVDLSIENGLSINGDRKNSNYTTVVNIPGPGVLQRLMSPKSRDKELLLSSSSEEVGNADQHQPFIENEALSSRTSSDVSRKSRSRQRSLSQTLDSSSFPGDERKRSLGERSESRKSVLFDEDNLVRFDDEVKKDDSRSARVVSPGSILKTSSSETPEKEGEGRDKPVKRKRRSSAADSDRGELRRRSSSEGSGEGRRRRRSSAVDGGERRQGSSSEGGSEGRRRRRSSSTGERRRTSSAPGQPKGSNAEGVEETLLVHRRRSSSTGTSKSSTRAEGRAERRAARATDRFSVQEAATMLLGGSVTVKEVKKNAIGVSNTIRLLF